MAQYLQRVQAQVLREAARLLYHTRAWTAHPVQAPLALSEHQLKHRVAGDTTTLE